MKPCVAIATGTPGGEQLPVPRAPRFSPGSNSSAKSAWLKSDLFWFQAAAFELDIPNPGEPELPIETCGLLLVVPVENRSCPGGEL